MAIPHMAGSKEDRDDGETSARFPAVRGVLERFFAAENVRDWHAYAAFLAPDVEWTLSDGSGERRIVGREEYLAAMRAAYEGVTTTFSCVNMMSGGAPGRVACLLIDDVGRRSLDIFDVDGGLIRREWEFLLD